MCSQMLVYKCSPIKHTYIGAPYDVAIFADFNGDVATRPVVVKYDDVLTLNCTSFGGSDNMFQWFKDDILLQENSDSVLSIAAISAADGGLYECVVNNTAGDSSANITIYGWFCVSLNTLYVVYFI